MILTKYNLLAFLILLILNIVPIYLSRRGKRFAYFSTKIFIVLFSTYWIVLLVSFQTFDFLNLGSTNPKTNAYLKPAIKYESTFVLKAKYESDTKYKIQSLNRIMTTAVIQAVLVILLAICGIIWLNDRLIYYIRVIMVFVVLIIFCCWIISSGSINGIEAITQ